MQNFKEYIENDSEYSILFNIDVSDESLEYLTTLYLCDSLAHGWQILPNIKPDYVNIPHLTNGYLDQYSYIINNLKNEKVKYFNRIIYQDISFLLNNIKINNTLLIEELSKHQDKKIATFKFNDPNKDLRINGELGYNAKFVMDFVITSVSDSLKRNATQIAGFYYSIAKSEQKRQTFYDQIIEKVVKYDKKFVDVDSNDKLISVYYIY
jgi:hypothetical protein